MINLDYLKQFIEVANCGSISKAAEKCFVERSNLSVTISRLEEHFGTELFKRSSKGTTLTPEGETVFEWAMNCLDKHDQLIESFQQSKENIAERYHLTLYTSIALNEGIYAKPLNMLLQKFPTLSVNITQTDGGKTEIDSILSNPKSAGLFSVDDDTLNAIKRIPELAFIKLVNIKFAAYSSPDSQLLKRYSSISLKTLSTMPLLLYAFNNHTPVFKFLRSYYSDKTIINTVSTPTMLQYLLATGNHVSIGTAPPNVPPVFESMKCVPIRDKIPLYFGVLLHKSDINDPVISSLLQAYCELLHLPEIPSLK